MKTVDYTKMRRNSMIANRYICVCPNCGKKGLRFVYPAKDGQQVSEYMHEGEKTLGGVEMTKSCRVAVEVMADGPDPSAAEYDHIKQQWANRPEANY